MNAAVPIKINIRNKAIFLEPEKALEKHVSKELYKYLDLEFSIRLIGEIYAALVDYIHEHSSTNMPGDLDVSLEVWQTRITYYESP